MNDAEVLAAADECAQLYAIVADLAVLRMAFNGSYL